MHRTGERLATVLEHPGRTGAAERSFGAVGAAASGAAASLGRLTLQTEWRSPAFRAALDRLLRFAPCRDPLLLTGETGAGKTAFAEIAHECGPEPDAGFMVVNAASLPDGLLQAELFGHKRGAFTGA
ncbi:MAG: sigma 54-interacting transcriptional regulator, partial [Gemmatimonadetes bacterium]|nr:sigma 54-interacting transcriptional regulator [Gemmatimonadota bacterium]